MLPFDGRFFTRELPGEIPENLELLAAQKEPRPFFSHRKGYNGIAGDAATSSGCATELRVLPGSRTLRLPPGEILPVTWRSIAESHPTPGRRAASPESRPSSIRPMGRRGIVRPPIGRRPPVLRSRICLSWESRCSSSISFNGLNRPFRTGELRTHMPGFRSPIDLQHRGIDPLPGILVARPHRQACRL